MASKEEKPTTSRAAAETLAYHLKLAQFKTSTTSTTSSSTKKSSKETTGVKNTKGDKTAKKSTGKSLEKKSALLYGADKSRFSPFMFRKACKIVHGIHHPEKKLPPPLFASATEKELAHELVINILKYSDFLNEALRASDFYVEFPAYKGVDLEEIIVVVYDLMERNFLVSSYDLPMPLRYKYIQNDVLAIRTKIMENIERLKIKYDDLHGILYGENRGLHIKDKEDQQRQQDDKDKDDFDIKAVLKQENPILDLSHKTQSRISKYLREIGTLKPLASTKEEVKDKVVEEITKLRQSIPKTPIMRDSDAIALLKKYDESVIFGSEDAHNRISKYLKEIGTFNSETKTTPVPHDLDISTASVNSLPSTDPALFTDDHISRYLRDIGGVNSESKQTSELRDFATRTISDLTKEFGMKGRKSQYQLKDAKSKRNLKKLAKCVDRLATHTHSSLSKQTQKWITPKDRTPAPSQPCTAASSRRDLDNNHVHGPGCICARHAKKFPEFKPR